MSEHKRLEEERQIFGNLFLISNRLQTLIDRDFAPHGFTAKQWFLMASIGDLGGTPRLSEVAYHMGTSHQNVKQLAKKLATSGFVDLFTDPEDRRAKRLKLTQQSMDFWQDRQHEDLAFLKMLFGSCSDDQVETLDACLRQMAKTLRQKT